MDDLKPIIPKASKEKIEDDDDSVDEECEQDDVKEYTFAWIHVSHFKIFWNHAHVNHSLVKLSAAFVGFFNHILGDHDLIKLADRK